MPDTPFGTISRKRVSANPPARVCLRFYILAMYIAYAHARLYLLVSVYLHIFIFILTFLSHTYPHTHTTSYHPAYLTRTLSHLYIGHARCCSFPCAHSHTYTFTHTQHHPSPSQALDASAVLPRTGPLLAPNLSITVSLLNISQSST